MTIGRRTLISGGAALLGCSIAPAKPPRGEPMYGLINNLTAVPGRRDDLIAILIESVTDMPGCLSYVVAKDPANEDGIWITEVWDSKASHDASLSLAAVRKAIAAGKPLIRAFDRQVVTTPVGGYGLAAAQRR